MQRRIFVVVLAMAACAIVFQPTSVQAGSVGTLQLEDTGAPTVNTGDILTATTFTINTWVTVGPPSPTGIFLGLPVQTIGSITFTNAGGVNTSFSFTNSVAGSFKSSSITETTSTTPGVGSTADFFIIGTYTGGSYDSTTSANGPAEVTVSFTQTPPHTGGISDSGTLSVGIPEPSTLVMGLISIGAFWMIHGLRRFRKAAA